MSEASCFASRSTSTSGTTYRGLGAGGWATTAAVVVVVVGAAVVVVVVVGAVGLVVGALASGATSVSDSTVGVEDGEHPETRRAMAARPTKLVAEAPKTRRTGSPYVPVHLPRHWLA